MSLCIDRTIFMIANLHKFNQYFKYTSGEDFFVSSQIKLSCKTKQNHIIFFHGFVKLVYKTTFVSSRINKVTMIQVYDLSLLRCIVL